MSGLDPLRRMTPFIRYADRGYGREALASTFAALCGGAIAPRFGIDTWMGFGLGFFGVGTLLAFWLTSKARFDRDMAYLRKLRDEKLISAAQFKRMTDRATEWYSTRHFGGGTTATEPPSNPPVTDSSPES